MITENYLHFVWKHKRLLNPNVTLTNGECIQIRNFGIHNELLKGPDFRNGSIKFDGLTFHGPIEIHVNSSDWYKHKHHEDKNYDNVILHVVYNHDRDVIQNNRMLPTLELKEHIDSEHLKLYNSYAINEKTIICSKGIEELPTIYLNAMKQKALYSKLTSKVERLQTYCADTNLTFYHFLANGFGGSVNRIGFIDLALKVPRTAWLNLNAVKRRQLLLSESGLGTNAILWNRKGARPANFPDRRLFQFSEVLGELEYRGVFDYWEKHIDIDHFVRLIRNGLTMNTNPKVKLSQKFIDLILINGVVPYLWYLASRMQEERFSEYALLVLEQIPPESNRIIKKWKRTGVQIKNAFDTQSLLALDRFYCCHKKCLSCEVGNKLLQMQ